MNTAAIFAHIAAQAAIIEQTATNGATYPTPGQKALAALLIADKVREIDKAMVGLLFQVGFEYGGG